MRDATASNQKSCNGARQRDGMEQQVTGGGRVVEARRREHEVISPRPPLLTLVRLTLLCTQPPPKLPSHCLASCLRPLSLLLSFLLLSGGILHVPVGWHLPATATLRLQPSRQDCAGENGEKKRLISQTTLSGLTSPSGPTIWTRVSSSPSPCTSSGFRPTSAIAPRFEAPHDRAFA